MTLRFELIPIRMTKIKDSKDNTCWQGCGARGTLWSECKLIQPINLVVSDNQEEFYLQTQLLLLGICLKDKGHLLSYAHSSFTLNSRKLETT